MKVKDARELITKMKALDLQASHRLWDFDGAILYGPNSDETGIAMDNPKDAEFLCCARNSYDVILAVAEQALKGREDDEPLFEIEFAGAPLYHLHYSLNGKSVIVQKPLTHQPRHDEVVRWGLEAFGVESLAGATIDLVYEGDPRFIGRLEFMEGIAEQPWHHTAMPIEVLEGNLDKMIEELKHRVAGKKVYEP